MYRVQNLKETKEHTVNVSLPRVPSLLAPSSLHNYCYCLRLRNLFTDRKKTSNSWLSNTCSQRKRIYKSVLKAENAPRDPHVPATGGVHSPQANARGSRARALPREADGGGRVNALVSPPPQPSLPDRGGGGLRHFLETG